MCMMQAKTQPILLLLCLLLAMAAPAFASDTAGIVTKPSQYDVATTLDRLEEKLKQKGITVAMRWQHHEKAASVGLSLRPTEIMIFGNPKLGTHLMQSEQLSAIDLPMKALAWQDAQGQVWLSYNPASYIAGRHGIEDKRDIINKMNGALDKLTDYATGQAMANK